MDLTCFSYLKNIALTIHMYMGIISHTHTDKHIRAHTLVARPRVHTHIYSIAIPIYLFVLFINASCWVYR
jgi:hypothetical protein